MVRRSVWETASSIGTMETVLRVIAKDGPDAFFRGEIADAIDADMRAHGGLLRRSDLEKLRIARNRPLSATFRNARVTTNQAPGGGIMLLEMLGALENFDLRSIGHNSVEYIRVVAEAMKAATRDKDLFIGDPSFVDVPADRLISKPYCAELAEGIKRGDKVKVDQAQCRPPQQGHDAGFDLRCRRQLHLDDPFAWFAVRRDHRWTGLHV